MVWVTSKSRLLRQQGQQQAFSLKHLSTGQRSPVPVGSPLERAGQHDAEPLEGGPIALEGHGRTVLVDPTDLIEIDDELI